MDTDTARRWVRRWDAQQERYVADREERFRVVADVVRAAAGSTHGLRVVDLGCGPGSLSDRLAAELPGAEIVGVDADSLLLELAAAGARPGVRFHRADLTDPGWADSLGLDGSWDAVVSSTALHWLEPGVLARVYRDAARRLRPGGVLVNADHLRIDHGTLDVFARRVRDRRAERVGVTGNEDWRSWWDALLAEPEVARFADARSVATIAHSEENTLSAREHVALLEAAGFTSASPVWQFGDDHVLVAVR